MKLDALQPILWLFIAAIIISFIVIFVFSWPGNHSAADNKLTQSEEDKKKKPDKVLPTFDEMFAYVLKAREADKRRIRNIYRLIYTILFAGILVIMAGVVFSLSESFFGTLTFSSLWSVIIAGIAITSTGVIMFFSYRSVLLHTLDYYQTLERLTWLGVSTKILDNLPEDKKAEAFNTLWEVHQGVFTNTKSTNTQTHPLG